MEDRGRLEVNINRRRNVARNSFNSNNSSENSHSNEFINSQNTHTERQSIALQTIDQASPQRNHAKEEAIAKEAKDRQINKNTDKNVGYNNNKLEIIREENLNFKAKNEQKKKVKGHSVQQSPPQQKRKEKNVMNNKSQLVQMLKEEKQNVENVEQQKISQINKKQQLLSSHINELKNDYQKLQHQQKQTLKVHKRKEVQSPFGVKLSFAKQRQIELFLQQKQKQKHARHKKLQDISLKQQHKRKLEEREQEMLKERDRKRKLKQLKRYSQFEDKHQQWKEKQEQKQQIVQQFLKKFEDQPKFHIRAQKAAEQQEQKRLKQQQKILQERRQINKSIDQQELMQHQRWHDDKLDQLNYERVQMREEEQQRISQQNQRLNDVWRGQVHGVVEEQLMEIRKKKRLPKERARRIKQYKQHIKKNFSPMTYQHKSLDTSQFRERSSNSHREVRRYRFYKGIAVGQVKEELPLPKTDRQVRKMGDNYLQYVKTLPKKAQQPEQSPYELDPEDLQILQRKFNGIGKVKRSINPIYNDSRKKKAIEVTKQVKRDQLQMIVLQLQATDDRLRNKQILLNQRVYGSLNNVQGEQKSINQGLVENIQRKLSLLAQI